MFVVDVLTVLAPGDAVSPQVLESLRNQGCVELRHHVIDGPRRAGELRARAIARARNRAKWVGSAHYALFLDRDVVLPPAGVEKLVCGLLFNPHYAALGINYQAEERGPGARHVAMGATLFIRPILEQIHFRAEPDRCECYCCCSDLRRMGYGIDYCPGLRAEHQRRG